MEWKKYTIITGAEALSSLRSSKAGLSQAEAERRILEYGRNSIEKPDHFFWRVARRRFRSLLSWIFILAAIVTFLSGSILESFAILLFLFLNLGIEVYQEFHSEKAARLLEHYLMARVRVRRDNQIREIATSFLVPGDIVLLKKGDAIPADVRFFEAHGLSVKEAHIESERKEIPKTAEILPANPLTLSSAQNIGFAGTSILEGSSEAVVIATGARTALGDIAYKSAETKKTTPFESNITHVSSFLVKLLLLGLLVVFVLYFLIHGEQVPLSAMIVFTLVLAITVVPETLPALTALALARGSVKLAKKGLAVKRLSAIEDLGSLQVLCVDKTGMLTENRLQVSHINGSDSRSTLRFALLAAHDDLCSYDSFTDPFDKALWEKASPELKKQVTETKRLSATGFNPETRLQAVAVREKKEGLIILRGAPEEVLRRVEKLDSFNRKRLQEWIAEAGHRGERVLAVAKKEFTKTPPAFHGEGGFTLEGLVAFFDPINPDAKNALSRARALGLEVKVLSGDTTEVVGAVCYATGVVKERTAVITGTEFEVLSLPEQIHALEHYSVFARFSPSQKSAAVQLLQKSHSVGFLGNGLTDLAALQLSQVGLVSGDAGDIAREASDILISEKNLAVVVEGIQESRHVFANILKYVKITLASNFGNFYAITLAALFLPYLPLLPLQILFLNFLSDLPMLAIAGDHVDHEKLVRPKDQNLHAIIVTATLFGMVSSFFDLTIFKIFSQYGQSLVQTSWFAFSVLTEVLILYSLRSRRWFFRADRPSTGVFLLSLVALGAAFIVPYTVFGALLGFEAIPGEIWLVIILVALGYFAVTEIIKRWYYLHSAFFTTKSRTF